LRASLSTSRPLTAESKHSDAVLTKTHTGQVHEPNDYRLARFVDRDKMVNKQFAINLIADIPPKKCNERITACDGGGGPLGHPKVFINLDKPGAHACGYCGLRFELDHDHGHGHAAHSH